MNDAPARQPMTHIDSDLQHSMQTVLDSYYRRLQEARDIEQRNVTLLEDNRDLKARLEEMQRGQKHMELELLEGRRREAKALEDIGVLKGIMQTHGASIADVVSRLGEPLPPPNNGERRQRPQPDLTQLARLIDTGQAQRPGGEA